jgi:hypothetical protein
MTDHTEIPGSDFDDIVNQDQEDVVEGWSTPRKLDEEDPEEAPER